MIKKLIIYRLLFTFIIVTLIGSTAFSQQKDALNTGEVKGVAFDSAHNYVLTMATVAIYKNDTVLVSYQLTNNFGEFVFKNLPVKEPLKIIISFSGYGPAVKNVTIADHNILNLNKVILDRQGKVLDEIVIKTIPPMQMNGDTLEFNADAFKMDPNAVAEDLLRRLPGVVIWGDGSITVNGKEVKQVLVEGKPFFGGNPKIAIQNIDKQAIDKIQVYQQNKEGNNRFDSVTNINIKLKKTKKFGHFGKLGLGYGTNNRYEADASFNIFNPSTQLGIVGSSNNINKMANSVSNLMESSTYKGVGASIAYQSNFLLPGINQFNVGGMTFQKDFVAPDYYKTDRISANYFLSHSDNLDNVQTNTITALGSDNTQSTAANNNTHTVKLSQTADAKYEKKKNNYAYDIGMNANFNDSKIKAVDSTTVSGLLPGIQSTSNTNINNQNTNNSFSLGANVKHNNSAAIKFPNDWELNYKLTAETNNNKQNNITAFNSFTDAGQNHYYDRKYDNRGHNIKHELKTEWGNLSRLITGRRFRFWNIETKLINKLEIANSAINNKVSDKSRDDRDEIVNPYLTVSSNYMTIDETPGIRFSKSFFKQLANRYYKNTTVSMLVKEQFYYQKNTSGHSFQDFNKTYQKFIPEVNINYYKNQLGSYSNSINLSYAPSYQYATPELLVPLADSTEIYYIRKGNPLLKPSGKQQLALNFSHYNLGSKNAFNYSFYLIVYAVNNYFADSTIIDISGRTTVYAVNLNGYKNASLSGGVGKAFNFKNHQLQLRINADYTLSKTPGYLQSLNNTSSIFNFSNNRSFSNNLDIYYTFKDKLTINIADKWNRYISKQSSGLKNQFSYTEHNTTLSASVNCTQKLTLSSNVSFNNNKSSASKSLNYTIWNANAAYRFLKGNNLELKLAAMDILHQNTDVSNFGDSYTVTYQKRKILQQYFMLSVSYFPRKFGKNKNEELP